MRNQYLDLLRALAVTRVVVYHTTSFALLTVGFPAMSLMFALAGSLMAASIDKRGARAIGSRLRRLLPPLWILAAVFVPAMVITGLEFDWRVFLWALPLHDPPANEWGSHTLSAIWYLRDYLWFVIVSPLALPLFRRFPVPAVLAPLGLLVAVELFGLPAGKVLADFGLYFGAWMIGFAHHDGMLRRMPKQLLFGLAMISSGLGAAWFLNHPSPRGYDLNDIRLGDGLWSTGFVLVILGLAPASAAWIDRLPPLRNVVAVLNRRAVTIYLWHIPALVGLEYLLTPRGLWRDDPAGLAFRLLMVIATLAVGVMLFGWVEDVASRRKPVLLPIPRVPTPSVPEAQVPAPRVPEAQVSGPRVPTAEPALVGSGRPESGPPESGPPESGREAATVPSGVSTLARGEGPEGQDRRPSRTARDRRGGGREAQNRGREARKQGREDRDDGRRRYRGFTAILPLPVSRSSSR